MPYNKRCNTKVAEENDIIIVMLYNIIETLVVTLITVLFKESNGMYSPAAAADALLTDSGKAAASAPTARWRSCWRTTR